MGSLSKEKIATAIRYVSNNKRAIQVSKMAGCYYCLSIFPTSLVKAYLDTEETALCPKCGIDSVLPSNSPFKLTAENLGDLHAYWFA